MVPKAPKVQAKRIKVLVGPGHTAKPDAAAKKTGAAAKKNGELTLGHDLLAVTAQRGGDGKQHSPAVTDVRKPAVRTERLTLGGGFPWPWITSAIAG